MRITVFYQDMPVPADQGGKADVWRRIAAFRSKGVAVQLVHWVPGGVDACPKAQLHALGAGVDALLSLDRGGRPGWKHLLSVPPWLANLDASPTKMREMIDSVRRFGSNAVWIEGPWTGEPASSVASALRLPLLYRSHNIEHLYMASQARAMKTLAQRFRTQLGFVHLRAYESALMARAQRVYDISCDDLLWWREMGIQRNHWLPPVSETAAQGGCGEVAQDIDVLFLGNLSAPNNVRSVLWLVEQVWPRVVALDPLAKLTIAGSGPSPDLRRSLESRPGVTLLPDVSDAVRTLARAKVHVNPALTGSGIQLKTMEMLMTSAPVVCTSQGAAGFPNWLKEHLAPVDDPGAFADRILSARVLVGPSDPRRLQAQALFSASAVDEAVGHLRAAQETRKDT